MSDIELKPCPFCGGEAQLVRDRIGLWRVGCKKCNCMTTYQFDFGEGEEASQKKAVNVWNTRKPMERVVEFPTEPIKVADLLIHDTCVYENKLFKGYLGDTSVVNRYSKSDLRQIAEHLLAYCNNAEEE